MNLRPPVSVASVLAAGSRKSGWLRWRHRALDERRWHHSGIVTGMTTSLRNPAAEKQAAVSAIEDDMARGGGVEALSFGAILIGAHAYAGNGGSAPPQVGAGPVFIGILGTEKTTVGPAVVPGIGSSICSVH